MTQAPTSGAQAERQQQPQAAGLTDLVNRLAQELAEARRALGDVRSGALWRMAGPGPGAEVDAWPVRLCVSQYTLTFVMPSLGQNTVTSGTPA